MSGPQSTGGPVWPEPPELPPEVPTELVKALYEAQLGETTSRWRDGVDAVRRRRDDERRLQDQAAAVEDTLREAVHAAYLQVAAGTLERGLKRADMVVAAAGAIGTSYSGLLALAFSVSADTPHPLPARALAPSCFLALSFFLSAVYVGFLRRRTRPRRLLSGGTSAQLQEQRLATFIAWANAGILARAWALRTAVVSMGAGIALLPLPFVDVSATLPVIGATAVVVASLLTEAIPALQRRRGRGSAA